MSSEALITVFLGFGAAVTSLTFWKLSQSRSPQNSSTR
ncbi:putative membrane protein [Synechococcus sp. MVIR-18-1]|nr:putative membrane protein [Synechococcus sp. MVIR-18-1]